MHLTGQLAPFAQRQLLNFICISFSHANMYLCSNAFRLHFAIEASIVSGMSNQIAN